MNGNSSLSYAYLSINFKDFYVHPEYTDDTKVENKGFAWEVGANFDVVKQTPKWDVIKVWVIVDLRNKDDKMKVSKLVVESSFKVFTKLSFDMKFKAIGLFINAAIGQFQGGWYVFHTNPMLKKMLPQALFHENELAPDLKKKIFEKWK